MLSLIRRNDITGIFLARRLCKKIFGNIRYDYHKWSNIIFDNKGKIYFDKYYVSFLVVYVVNGTLHVWLCGTIEKYRRQNKFKNLLYKAIIDHEAMDISIKVKNDPEEEEVEMKEFLKQYDFIADTNYNILDTIAYSISIGQLLSKLIFQSF